MITIKDYATKRDTTTQAIYKLIKKHSKELEGHITKQNGVKVIDKQGEEYLDTITNKNQPVPIDKQQQEKIEKLERELESAKSKVAELYEEMRQKDNYIIGLQQSNQVLMLELKEEKEKKWWKKIFK